MLSINFTPAVAATTVTTKNTQQSEALLIAQQAFCNVSGIQSGQLALRFTPDGKSKAGLDNGNTVELLHDEGSGVWIYVRVINGPNSAVNNLEGWVNSNYLSCSETSEASHAFCNVSGIQTGQLALRFTPNGKSKAGLDNGNTVELLHEDSGVWSYVRVVDGPNSAVNDLEGWVNANYLSC
ncbi:MAG: SH3 domain-containing protein [Aphanothece sp. CMT-3BRIN-NPC111]|nr:SH3 domain-containing protein [Aphanothece sp. CMT-3BRIN-NPC111]